MRRVARLRPRQGQLELDTDLWRHHTVLTDRPEPMLTVEAEHRAHTVIETVITDLKGNAMAHLPSGDVNANAAWLALAALTHNLTRTLATLTGHGLHHATTATTRRTLIAVPARLVRSARKQHLRPPEHPPWQTAPTWCRRRIDTIPCSTEPAPLTTHDQRPTDKPADRQDNHAPSRLHDHHPQPRSEPHDPNLAGGCRLRSEDLARAAGTGSG